MVVDVGMVFGTIQISNELLTFLAVKPNYWCQKTQSCKCTKKALKLLRIFYHLDDNKDNRKYRIVPGENWFTILFQQFLQFFHQGLHFTYSCLFLSLPFLLVPCLENKRQVHK